MGSHFIIFAVKSALAQIFARDMRRRICPIWQCVMHTESAATFSRARARKGLSHSQPSCRGAQSLDALERRPTVPCARCAEAV
jgi:hypothetical protein